MLPTLHCRRMRGDMIETYKMMSGKYDTTLTTFLAKTNESIISLPTRGHSLKLYVQRAEKVIDVITLVYGSSTSGTDYQHK